MEAGSCSSSSPSITSSVMARKGGWDDLDYCSMHIWTCSSMLWTKKALGPAVGLSPALVPGWAEKVAACKALLLVRLYYLGCYGSQGSRQSLQGLLHFPQGGSFILTRKFLC